MVQDENTDKDFHANLDVSENETPEAPAVEETPDRIKLVINSDSSLDLFLGATKLNEGADYDVEDNRPVVEEGEADETPEVSDEAENEKKNEPEVASEPDEVAVAVPEGICPVCNGRGLIDNNTKCSNCNASGRVE